MDIQDSAYSKRSDSTDQPLMGASRNQFPFSEKEKQESIYQRLIENVSDAIIALDMDFCIVSWNRAAEDIYRWGEKEVRGKPLDKILNSSYVDTNPKKILNSLREEGFWRGEVIQYDKGGREIYVLSSLSLIKDLEGYPSGFVVVNKDISDRKRTEERLRNYAVETQIIHNVILAGNQAKDLPDLMKQIVDSILELLDFDAGGIFLIEENQTHARLHYAANIPQVLLEQLKYVPITDFPMEQVFVKGKPLITENYDVEAPERYKLTGYLSLGAIPIFLGSRVVGAFNVASTRRKRFSSNEKNVILTIGQQIGTVIAHMQTKAEIQALNQDLEMRVLQRTEELNYSNSQLEKFAAVIAHDLREPMRMVSSYLDLLVNRLNDKLEDNEREYIAYAKDGAKRMKSMLDGILKYSQVNTQKQPFQIVGINDILAEVKQNLCITLKQYDVEISHNELPEIWADKSQMIQLFQNLISNAVKYCDKEVPRIEINVSELKDSWKFSIKDNGIGIPKGYRQKIFQMFSRIPNHSQYPGHGVGLSISQGIVERHGGKIWFDSEEGEGTTFFFTIRKLNSQEIFTHHP